MVLKIVSFSMSITSFSIGVDTSFICLAILKFKLDTLFMFFTLLFSITHEPVIPTLFPPFMVIKPSYICFVYEYIDFSHMFSNVSSISFLDIL